MTDLSPRNRTTQSEHAALDELFDVLSKPPRRRILIALVDANRTEVAEFVPGDGTSDERQEDIVIGLHHTHLPKLDDAGFIEWNHGSKTITRGPRFDEIAPLVEVLIDHQEALSVGWP